MKKNIVVSLISKETIKPCSLKSPKPFKLSFMDQLTPNTCVPLIFFYPKNINQNLQIFSSNLKLSLSQTLSTFYPFSGRLKGNLFVDDFEKGVSYSETQVSSDLFEFLRNPHLEMLDQFLLVQPYTQTIPPDETLPLLYVQCNVFQCGGIAIGICMSHKIADIYSYTNFLRNWADNNKNLGTDSIISEINIKTINASIEEPSLRFPPFKAGASEKVQIMDRFFFDEKKHTPRRFFFDAKAIASLQEKAKNPEEIKNGERMTNTPLPPSRVKTLSSFIWRCCTLASATISSTPRLSISAHFMNIRRRTQPCLPEYPVGNLVWSSVSVYEILFEDDHKRLVSDDHDLNHFVELTNQSMEEVNAEFLKSLDCENGDKVASEFVEQVNEIFSTNPDVFMFSSWLNFGINDLDFGLGKPLWVSLMGDVNSAVRNLIILKEFNGGIEAWMTLEDDLMEILENDPQFLTFATPNPPILIDPTSH